jgi:primosomal protein N'
VLAKIRSQYRWHTIVKSDKERDPSGGIVHKLVQRARQGYGQKAPAEVKLLIDVDPAGLM